MFGSRATVTGLTVQQEDCEAGTSQVNDGSFTAVAVPDGVEDGSLDHTGEIHPLKSFFNGVGNLLQVSAPIPIVNDLMNRNNQYIVRV